MADWLSMALTGLGGLMSANQASKNARLANKQFQFQRDLFNQYGIPELQTQAGQFAGYQPVYNTQLAWLYSLLGMQPGYQFSTPATWNPQVPDYLRDLGNAPEGSWQKELYKTALYNNWDKKTVAAYKRLKDRWDERAVKRGYTLAPAEFAAPPVRVGGETYTVPGATGTGAVPDWLKVPELNQTLVNQLTTPPALAPGTEEALRDVPDWRTPFTPEEIAAMTDVSSLNLDAYKRQLSNDLAANLARRGLTGPSVTSSADISGMASVRNWYQQAKAGERARMAQLGMERGNQLREERNRNLLTLNQLQSGLRNEYTGNLMNLNTLGEARRAEQARNYDWLLRAIAPQSMSQSAQSWLPMTQNLANAYQQNAALFGQAAAQSLGALGGMYGYNRYGQGATVNKPITQTTATSGASGLVVNPISNYLASYIDQLMGVGY